MCEATFHPFATLPEQSLSALALNPPPVLVNRLLLFSLAFPVAPPASGFRAIRAHTPLAKAHQDIVAVITLVQHVFHRTCRIYGRSFSGVYSRFTNVLASLTNRLVHRPGIAIRGRLQRDRHDRARFQIDCMFGLEPSAYGRPSSL